MCVWFCFLSPVPIIIKYKTFCEIYDTLEFGPETLVYLILRPTSSVLKSTENITHILLSSSFLTERRPPFLSRPLWPPSTHGPQRFPLSSGGDLGRVRHPIHSVSPFSFSPKHSWILTFNYNYLLGLGFPSFNSF